MTQTAQRCDKTWSLTLLGSPTTRFWLHCAIRVRQRGLLLVRQV